MNIINIEARLQRGLFKVSDEEILYVMSEPNCTCGCGSGLIYYRSPIWYEREEQFNRLLESGKLELVPHPDIGDGVVKVRVVK